ncbi:MAG: DUF3662 domain-containing protein [Anaerolineae bacterium]|nr:DUF3662 domain-containing protein [Anaerolineae bacterium]
MNDYRLARIEARIASLVEGAFAQVFGSPGGLQSVATRLSITLDEADRMAGSLSSGRRFVVRMEGSQLEALRAAWPDVEDGLARQLAEQRSLRNQPALPLPVIGLEADDTLAAGAFVVLAVEPETKRDPTGVLPRIQIPAFNLPAGAVLLNGSDEIPLASAVITLGRSPDCTIILHDPYVSRIHAQIRLKGGRFVVLDAGGQSGTFVNGALIHEHWLYPGDVIQLGRTIFVYQDQHQPDISQATQPIEPMD